MSDFDIIFEKEIERFQSGGVLIGDRVRFRKNCLNLDYVKNRASSYQDMIKACMEPTFDLNLRVGAVKSIYPTTTQNYTGGSESPDGVYLDVYIEYAPGLYRNPITIPIEAVEVIDDGNNRGPVPDSLKRKNNTHGPKEIKTEPTNNAGTDVNYASKNTAIPTPNSWNDSLPGGGNMPQKGF